MIVVLCEKGEQLQQIGTGLGLTENGPSWSGQWKGEEMVAVTASGHLYRPISPQDAKPDANWKDPATLLPLPTPGKLEPTERGQKMLPGIRRALERASVIWLATDPDREGEAIGRDIIAASGAKAPVQRLWLTGSLEPDGIQAAAKRLRDGKELLPLWRAQQARRGSDWLWQFLVRAYTASARRGLMGPELAKGEGRAGLVSVGRVQTATLKLVYDREALIANHRQITHYEARFDAAGLTFRFHPERPVEPAPGVHVQDSGDPLFLDRGAMATLVATLTDTGVATLATLTRKRGNRNPPLPHSLTTLQRAMNKAHGMSAGETLDVADDLRLNGYLTYPRTEHGELPISYYAPEQLKPILRSAAHLPDLKDAATYVAKLHCFDGPQDTPPKCFTDKPMEHHGIIPTPKPPAWSQWDPKQRRVYREVCRALVQALHPPAVVEKIEAIATVDCDDVLGRNPARFRATRETIIEPGFLATFAGKSAETPVPALQEGGALAISQAQLHEAQTKPPPPFTEDTLLGAMLTAGRAAEGEDAKILHRVEGIGTPATRFSTIETLLERNFLERRKAGKEEQLRITPRGNALIDQVPPVLADVARTASLERALDAITEMRSDSEAQKARNAFITSEAEQLTTHINEVIETMSNAPAPKPTEKMINAAEKIADSRNITLPEGYKDSFETCRTFLDETMQQPAPPTPKMAEYAKRIHEDTGIELGDALESFEACKAYIDEHASKAQRSRKPTDKMVGAARAIAKRKNIDLPDNVAQSFEACRAFLDAHPKGS